MFTRYRTDPFSPVEIHDLWKPKNPPGTKNEKPYRKI